MTMLPSKQGSNRTKCVTYCDLEAYLFLCQKAFLMVPIGAVAVIPIVGLLFRSMGTFANQLGFGLVLVFCFNWFIEDLLKRKIRMDEEYLYFGYRAIRIDELVSIDVGYRRQGLVPKSLLLTNLNGQILKLSLGGFSEDGLETLLKHLQSRNSRLKSTAILNTLVKCRRVVPKPIVDTQERLLIPYSGTQVIDEGRDTFVVTARSWMQMGPLLVCFAMTPVWMLLISTLYVSVQSAEISAMQSLNLYSFVAHTMRGMQELFLGSLQDSIVSALKSPPNAFITVMTCSLLTGLFLLFQYVFWRPNSLLADEKGIMLQFRAGGLCIGMGQADWSEIRNAELYKPPGHAGVDSWKIRLTKQDGKKLDLSLSAISPIDRSRLLKRMERLISNCEISPELSQSMLPKTDRSYTEIWLQSLRQAPERKTLDPLEPGQTIGENRFEILKTLGVGGQGTAYLCRHVTGTNVETVVLKETILPVFVEDGVRRSALERFEREARMLKSIDDDGIVKLTDYFIEDHRAYLVLEHIDGHTLRELILRDGPMCEEKSLDLAFQMCNLLNVLHSHSIVHRDFTPDNLILNSKGILKLIDFNVAQEIRDGATGTVVGKHAYLPPEQFRGKATSQSDLYAFGATMFFLLTGSDPEPISQSSPAQKNELVSSALDQIVKQATALQVNKRYKTAQDIEVDLLAIDNQRLEDGTTLLVKTRNKENVVNHG